MTDASAVAQPGRGAAPACDFVPSTWLPGPHLQTIIPSFWPQTDATGARERRPLEVTPGSHVHLDILRPESAARGTVLLVHGLGGSAASSYMRVTSAMALEQSRVAARLDLRGCGAGGERSRTSSNAAQSDDVGAALADLEGAGHPRPFALIGFSLGGNLVLRYAARAGSGSLADSVVAINPPLELETCAQALERPQNRPYNAFFTWTLCRQLRARRRLHPVPGPVPSLRRVKNLRNVDRLYIAPGGGYPSVDAYYADASSGPLLGRLRVPALVVSAADDPIIPIEMFTRYHGVADGRVRFLHPAAGGHVGYRQGRAPRFWAGAAALAFIRGAVERG